MSLQHCAVEAVAISCPLRWLVVALCIAIPIDAAMLANVICKEFMRYSFLVSTAIIHCRFFLSAMPT
jgi:hypothetical protein